MLMTSDVTQNLLKQKQFIYTYIGAIYYYPCPPAHDLDSHVSGPDLLKKKKQKGLMILVIFCHFGHFRPLRSPSRALNLNISMIHL